MKKKNVIIFAALFSQICFGQPYGQREYVTGVKMTSGTITGLNSNGFLMAGVVSEYDPTTNTYFMVDKTDIGGGFTSSSTEFKKHYNMWESGGCSLGNSITRNAGVSVIECNAGVNGEWYALAGAYNGGCFFTTLGSTGNTITVALYPFPYDVNSTKELSKPVIEESKITSNEFYIAGHIDSLLYVLKVNLTGGIIWSSYYGCGGTYKFIPKDIIESPHGSNDLVIVGITDGPTSLAQFPDGFFLTLDNSNGSVNNYNIYGDANPPCNEFHSISVASDNNGFIIGGFSDPYGSTPLNTGHDWMVRVDAQGNINWNKIITGSSNPTGGAITGVVERQGFTGYQYYGVANTSNFGSVVFKLNNSGQPFSGTNEYFYPGGGAGFAIEPIALTADNSAPNDVGLHIYARYKSNSYYLIQSYFNGKSGCNENLTTITTTENGPPMLSPWIVQYGSFTKCNDLGIVPSTYTYNINSICNANTVIGGSNARQITTIDENTANSEVKIFPNPSSGLCTVKMIGTGKIRAFSTIGIEVFNQELGNGENTVDFSNLENGTYYFEMTAPQVRKNFVLIKQ